VLRTAIFLESVPGAGTGFFIRAVEKATLSAVVLGGAGRLQAMVRVGSVVLYPGTSVSLSCF
jgi:hypothetical protein